MATVKFSKKQIVVLQDMFVTARETYNECMKEKPQIYNESGFYPFFYGYARSYFDFLAENGFTYFDCESVKSNSSVDSVSFDCEAVLKG